MKRPHRSIETFDISLMAVVTKAMGAFLVLMLLLIPYYKSGPIAQKPIDDLAKKVEEIDKSIKDVVDKLATASAEDLRKLLEEARQRLQEARKMIVELKRAIDQLNAQVQRLEEEKAKLAAENEQLRKDKLALTEKVEQLQKDKDALTAAVASLNKQIEEDKAKIAELEKENDALNAQIAALQKDIQSLTAQIAKLQKEIQPLRDQVAALQKENETLRKEVDPLKQENQELKEEINQLNGNVIVGEATSPNCQGVKFAIGLGADGMYSTLPDKSKSNYVLDYTNSLGDSIAESILGNLYLSNLLYRGASPGTYYLMIVSRSPAEITQEAKSQNKIAPLKQPSAACSGFINITAKLRNGLYSNFYANSFTLQQNKYAWILADIVVTDSDVKALAPSPQGAAWLKDQLDHAEKVAGTQPSAPEVPAVPAATQNVQRKPGGFSPFPSGLGNKPGFPRLPPGVGPPGGQR